MSVVCGSMDGGYRRRRGVRQNAERPTVRDPHVGGDGPVSTGLDHQGDGMTEVHHGLEGVIAFETEIAEPDKEGSALRYRGVDIEDLVGRVSYGNVWGLLVDGRFAPGLPPAEPFPVPVHSGDIRVDVQSALATL